MEIPFDQTPQVKSSRKRVQRPRKEDRRPWLVGTDDIPPPMDVGWQMWSGSSSPYEQGLVKFEFTPKGLAVMWFGINEDRYVIEWHELASLAGNPPRFAEQLEYLREQAVIEAINDDTDSTREVAVQQAYERGFQDGVRSRLGEKPRSVTWSRTKGLVVQRLEVVE